MSDEVKSEDKVVEKKQNDRGIVGKGTFSVRLKSLHAKYGRGLSLKTFVNDQAKDGNPDAAQWILAKKGAFNAARSDNSVKRISVEKNATKMAKKSKGKAGGGKAKTAVDGTA